MNTYKEPRFYIAAIGVSIFALMLLSYAAFQARHLIIGPTISIENPSSENLLSLKELIEIRGKAQNISSISLNDRPIFINEDGQFSEKLLLAKGYTIMTIKAEDRFGRAIVKTLHIVRN